VSGYGVYALHLRLSRGAAELPAPSPLSLLLLLLIGHFAGVFGACRILDHHHAELLALICRWLSLSPEYFALLWRSSPTPRLHRRYLTQRIQAFTGGNGMRHGNLVRRSFILRHIVILPAALRVLIPPMTSQYLNLTKNSSLVRRGPALRTSCDCEYTRTKPSRPSKPSRSSCWCFLTIQPCIIRS